MNIYTVAFFGHSCIENIAPVEDALFELIENLLREKDYVEFLVGKSGDFDRCVSSVITRLKRTYRDDNCCHILVLPYVTAEYTDSKEYFEEFYDEITVYDPSGRFHPKAVYFMRNMDMADSADEIICYIERKSGGAYKAVKYAEGKGKKITNIADRK